MNLSDPFQGRLFPDDSQPLSSGIDSAYVRPQITHALFRLRDGTEGSINLTSKPGDQSVVLEILSTLQEKSRTFELKYFMTHEDLLRGQHVADT